MANFLHTFLFIVLVAGGNQVYGLSSDAIKLIEKSAVDVYAALITAHEYEPAVVEKVKHEQWSKDLEAFEKANVEKKIDILSKVREIGANHCKEWLNTYKENKENAEKELKKFMTFSFFFSWLGNLHKSDKTKTLYETPKLDEEPKAKLEVIFKENATPIKIEDAAKHFDGTLNVFEEIEGTKEAKTETAEADPKDAKKEATDESEKKEAEQKETEKKEEKKDKKDDKKEEAKNDAKKGKKI